MNSSYQAYQQHRANAWCRVDMLLALYDAALRNVDAAISASTRGDTELAQQHRNKTLRIVLELYAGLDLSYGELPARVAQLCEYMQYVLLTGQATELASVREVLKELREGFQAIRSEAIRLEQEGKIPGIESAPKCAITA